MTTQIVGGVLRALLAAAPGAIISDGEVEQIVTAVAVLVTVAWSIWQKYDASRDKAVPSR